MFKRAQMTEIRTSDNRAIDCSDFGIVWLLDIRFTAFHCNAFQAGMQLYAPHQNSLEHITVCMYTISHMIANSWNFNANKYVQLLCLKPNNNVPIVQYLRYECI